MAFKVKWTLAAFKDLENAVKYLAQDSPNYADSFRVDVLDAAETLARNPMRGRRLTALKPAGIREIFEGSYRILYLPALSEVRILAVLHGARNLKWVWKRSAKKRS